jgi:uncharacterized protein
VPPTVLVDSSALFAVTVELELHHVAATTTLKRLIEGRSRLITTNLVLAETQALIVNRTRRSDKGTAFLTDSYDSRIITIVRVTEADEARGLAILHTYRDKLFSFTDTTSFAVLQRLGIRHAFTFDADFRQYGWLVLGPDPP